MAEALLEKGAKVRVTRITPSNFVNPHVEAIAHWRVGQRGVVLRHRGETDDSNDIEVRFEAPDVDGDCELSFSADELEAIA